MAATTVTCPSCNVTLKPKTPLAAGTRIKCPKCATVFVVPADGPAAPRRPAPKPTAAVRQEEPEDIEENTQDVGDEPEDEEPEERPLRRKKKKNLKKKGVPLWVWLTAGGGVFLLLCCTGCVGFFWYIGSTVLNAGSGSVTFLNYAQVQEGMSESQVKTIMGGSPQAAIQIGNMKTETWQSGSDVITVIFTDDKAVNRTCHLTSKSGQVITQSGFTGH